MAIVFRADASVHIGTGHIMRCLVLADQLRQYGHKVVFAMRAQNGDLFDLVESRGLEVRKLIEPSVWKKPSHGADYASWLQVSELEDAEDFCHANQDAELVIVDHYGLGKEWESRVRDSLGCKLFVIDDLLREHVCDLVLDQSLGRARGDYNALLPTNALQIVGTDYALLNPNFARQRLAQRNHRSPSDNHRVLVTMGGIDSTNITLAVLKQLVDYRLTFFNEVTVVINPKSPYYGDVVDYVKGYKDVMRQIDFVDDMAELMASHTLAIGAPGATSWERACMGLPSIIVPLAENQHNICQQLVQSGVAIKIERSNLKASFKVSLDALISDYENYAENCQRICDGLGVYRAAYCIDRAMDLSDSPFYGCRLATLDDIELVYSWQSLPETRRFSLVTDIPTIQAHTLWMKQKLNSTRDFFYIAEANIEHEGVVPVGVVRLDEQDNSNFLLSIYVCPDFYGMGIATSALAFIDAVHKDVVINATVLSENIASQKLFTKAGYRKIDEEHFQRSVIGDKK